MIHVPTTHNEAKKGDIAKTVLMPGDPLRAKYIAEKYLKDFVCYNQVRGMLGYTGYYKGKRISVQGSGMGIPSMAIYSKELFEGYDVDNIIRIGSAGTLANPRASKEANQSSLGDIVVAKDVYTDSNYGVENHLEEIYPVVSSTLLEKLLKITDKVKIGTIFTSDTFYKSTQDLVETSKLDILGVEMETYALYLNALVANKKALALFTITDNPITNLAVSSEQRETGLDDMIKIALELAIQCEEEK